ncbi:hypothetical protein EI94DRAFT_861887 [Lactarius quietus]|nr:hypothetical protein EI94DRAFT_861887 [Lactarius quietus]
MKRPRHGNGSSVYMQSSSLGDQSYGPSSPIGHPPIRCHRRRVLSPGTCKIPLASAEGGDLNNDGEKKNQARRLVSCQLTSVQFNIERLCRLCAVCCEIEDYMSSGGSIALSRSEAVKTSYKQAQLELVEPVKTRSARLRNSVRLFEINHGPARRRVGWYFACRCLRIQGAECGNPFDIDARRSARREAGWRRRVVGRIYLAFTWLSVGITLLISYLMMKMLGVLKLIFWSDDEALRLG